METTVGFKATLNKQHEIPTAHAALEHLKYHIDEAFKEMHKLVDREGVKEFNLYSLSITVEKNDLDQLLWDNPILWFTGKVKI
jgi:hypothetical protein